MLCKTIKERLEAAIEGIVEPLGPVMASGVGLRLRFAQASGAPVALGSYAARHDKKVIGAVFNDLVTQHHMLVLEGCAVAWQVGLHTSHISYQDPFHRDAFNPNPPLSLLAKPLLNSRKTPTYYAMAADVREAVAQINKKGWSKDLKAAARRYAESDFSLCAPNLPARELLQNNVLDFTRQVFEKIPEDRRYAQPWLSGEWVGVVHGNHDAAGILHARPYSEGDAYSPINVYTFPRVSVPVRLGGW